MATSRRTPSWSGAPRFHSSLHVHDPSPTIEPRACTGSDTFNGGYRTFWHFKVGSEWLPMYQNEDNNMNGVQFLLYKEANANRYAPVKRPPAGLPNVPTVKLTRERK